MPLCLTRHGAIGPDESLVVADGDPALIAPVARLAAVVVRARVEPVEVRRVVEGQVVGGAVGRERDRRGGQEVRPVRNQGTRRVVDADIEREGRRVRYIAGQQCLDAIGRVLVERRAVEVVVRKTHPDELDARAEPARRGVVVDVPRPVRAADGVAVLIRMLVRVGGPIRQRITLIPPIRPVFIDGGHVERVHTQEVEHPVIPRHQEAVDHSRGHIQPRDRHDLNARAVRPAHDGPLPSVILRGRGRPQRRARPIREELRGQVTGPRAHRHHPIGSGSESADIPSFA